MQLQTVSEAAASAETARAVAVSELELRRASEVEAGRRAERERELLTGTFSELSAQALAKNNEQFLTLADSKLNEVRAATQGDLSQRQQAIAQLLDPLSETLARYERGLRDMEVERKGAYATLNERVAALHLGHEQLQKRDPEPRHGVAVPADARTLGRNDAAQRGQGGRHGRALRLRGATVDHDGGRPAPSGHDRAPARRRPGRDRLQGPSGRLLEVHRVRRRGRAQGVPQEARRTVAHPRGSAGQEGVLEAVRALARVRGRLHPRRVAAGGGLRGRSRTAGPRAREGHRPGHPEHPGGRAEDHRPVLAAGDAGRERTRGPPVGSRVVRAVAHHDGTHGVVAAQPLLDGRGVQQGRRILRVTGARHGAQSSPDSASWVCSRARSPSSRRSRRRPAISRPTSPSSRTRSSRQSTIVALPEGGANTGTA